MEVDDPDDLNRFLGSYPDDLPRMSALLHAARGDQLLLSLAVQLGLRQAPIQEEGFRVLGRILLILNDALENGPLAATDSLATAELIANSICSLDELVGALQQLGWSNDHVTAQIRIDDLLDSARSILIKRLAPCLKRLFEEWSRREAYDQSGPRRPLVKASTRGPSSHRAGRRAG